MIVSSRSLAWQELYDAHAVRLWRNIAQRIAHGADVADVVQETLFAAARHFDQYDPRFGSAWNWLWGIGHRQVALYYRKRARNPATEAVAETLADWLEQHDESAEASAIRSEWGELIRQALATLPPEYDALLTARYLDERTVDDLAHELKLSEMAVRSKLARARAALREALLRFAPCFEGEQP